MAAKQPRIDSRVILVRLAEDAVNGARAETALQYLQNFLAT